MTTANFDATGFANNRSATPRSDAVRDIEVDRETLDASIAEFAGPRADYYADSFHTIHDTTGPIPRTFNLAAFLAGPFWASARGAWGLFWGFIILEVIAFVQIGRGSWGQLGAEDLANAQRQQARAQEFLQRAADAVAAGEDGTRFETLGNNLMRAAERSRETAEAAAADAAAILLTGLAMLLVLRLIQAVYANVAYEKQYTRWRVDPLAVPSGLKVQNAVLGLVLGLVIVPLTVYRFTIEGVPGWMAEFPADPDTYSVSARWLEGVIDDAARSGAGTFDGIVLLVRQVLDAISLALIGTPWPVVMTVIVVIGWRSAGPRVAIFTAAALAYIAFLGYWEIAMETVALVGAAVVLCVIMGIPLGIWFGKSQRAYNFAEPVLDLMQTLPAFVYLIPIIAFFGTGNPPGILATIIFGMPPVIRLTALGMRGVPDSIKEAATAFGASRWQLLKDVELPLALPSIMTGVNQTILMCLSMVVIISLIGGGGLGQVILEALQFAAKGPGLLGGFAILFVAMVIDRIVQGAFRRADQR
ncbi:ABC transporter permease [Pontivivens insulae]|uniref:Glycine betaine/proline betaine transport system permease protein ProW n=1 Tax=Pontivivens insulae TaxID=1639689 RepID=A0A2R8A9P9_9RHOB|nr:ABC transporter permease subunit [Pontivivens insulae]RED18848.1 glycine betaine/proline transport system permease protein [Pontivivens insulae]SPF28748.1 Glycine betaine/proline betaine transport system permease protein ProW [Pontivivens insulae]